MSEDLLTEPDAGATAVGIWLTGAGIGLHNYFFFYVSAHRITSKK